MDAVIGHVISKYQTVIGREISCQYGDIAINCVQYMCGLLYYAHTQDRNN